MEAESEQETRQFYLNTTDSPEEIMAKLRQNETAALPDSLTITQRNALPHFHRPEFSSDIVTVVHFSRPHFTDESKQKVQNLVDVMGKIYPGSFCLEHNKTLHSRTPGTGGGMGR